MRVVKITANFYPLMCGIGDYTRTLAENLVNLKKDISFYIITSANPRIKESCYSYDRIEVLPIISVWSFKALFKIRKVVKEISPDIVHIEYNRMLYGCNIAMNFLPYLLKMGNPSYKIIITFHDLPHPIKNRDPFFWLTNLANLIYCDRAIFTNDADFSSFILRLPFVKRKSTLVPVGSNIPKVEGRRAFIRRELNISDDEMLLSFFGFIREDKGLIELFLALSQLVRGGRKLRLLIIGGILNREKFLVLQGLSHKLNLDGKVIWTGYQLDKRVSQLLSASDIAVLPNRNGMGTNSGVLAACALHNLPIVTTKAKVMPEIIRDNHNAMLVTPRNVKELTNVLFRVRRDPNSRKRLSENLKGLNEYLSWRRISQEIFNLYARLWQ